MARRVVVTGIAGISPTGNDWASIRKHLGTYRNAVTIIDEWLEYKDLNTKVGARAAAFDLTPRFDDENMRNMGRGSIMAARCSELALKDAGLLEDPLLKSGKLGIAYGSCSGSPPSFSPVWRMLEDKKTSGFDPTTFFKMAPHTAALNIGSFLGVSGRIITTSSACTSGSQGIGYAYESIHYGSQIAMIAGGAEELNVTQAAVFDTLYATSTKNDAPSTTPSPWDASRDGLVIGEGAGSLILEDYEHALARGASIYAEVVGFGTNSDGCHVTQPNAETMKIAMQLALTDAGLQPSDIGYVNAHGTGTQHGDIAESHATEMVFGKKVPISSLKSYMGHTLGACGALEAWISIEMMREGWFAPTVNLNQIDPLCADLDYIVGEGRRLQCEYVMSNNFAFGGINTSLIFKRM